MGFLRRRGGKHRGRRQRPRCDGVWGRHTRAERVGDSGAIQRNRCGERSGRGRRTAVAAVHATPQPQRRPGSGYPVGDDASLHAGEGRGAVGCVLRQKVRRGREPKRLSGARRAERRRKRVGSRGPPDVSTDSQIRVATGPDAGRVGRRGGRRGRAREPAQDAHRRGGGRRGGLVRAGYGERLRGGLPGRGRNGAARHAATREAAAACRRTLSPAGRT
mmetsp:Transcript_10566/g.32816  ORF Transcript_10566/g.32816 Transcript_10566/m.32816 type:complete len:218 (+) Transcript_10566:126-779(+)